MAVVAVSDAWHDKAFHSVSPFDSVLVESLVPCGTTRHDRAGCLPALRLV